MRALLLLALLAACGDNRKAPVAGDAGIPSTAKQACLDRPDELPRAPTGALPCELLPPGLVLE
jgi:hypothetical protein